jgi:hypothetical protein
MKMTGTSKLETDQTELVNVCRERNGCGFKFFGITVIQFFTISYITLQNEQIITPFINLSLFFKSQK